MKDTPLLFKKPMVLAILDDSKEATRRFINKLLGFGKIIEFQESETPGYDWTFRNKRLLWNDITHAQLLDACPYGKIGDQLWVKETHAVVSTGGAFDDTVYYMATPETVLFRHSDKTWNLVNSSGWKHEGKWQPSIFMRREYSRIQLEITNVRVERLRSITESDAIKEGTVRVHGGWMCYTGLNSAMLSAADSFLDLWASINGVDSVYKNPWVWVIEFKRIKP